jgi:hypothetical protein
MGLDMHLYNKLEEGEPDWERLYKRLEEGEPFESVTPFRDIAYWRKFNALHQWFVMHVQNGNDDCRRYPVTRQHLIHLLDTLKSLSGEEEDARQKLPPQSGFFFGSTDIDARYWSEVERTIATIEKLLGQPDADYWFHNLFYLADW